MYLSPIKGEHFRALSPFALHLEPGLNLITGDNAAGKTSLLEAIFILSRGRSFRSPNFSDLIPPNAAQLRLSGQINRAAAAPEFLEFVWGREGSHIRDLAGNPLSLVDAARILPAQIIEPGSHRLLEEGPAWRRRYLDWGLFHVEPSFFPVWRRYQRALRQRNQVLRQGGSQDLVRAWDPDLAEAGELMHSLRAALVEKLLVPLGRMVRQLLDTDAWQLELSRGWSSEESLAETLVSGYSRDLSQGQTMHGPHRAELKLRLHDHAARNRVSRGQQKLLVCALALAQTSLVSEAAGVSPVLLLDDFSAELGAEFQRRLAVALSSYRGQQVVTATDRAAALGAPAAVFHVEHGRVERLA